MHRALVMLNAAPLVMPGRFLQFLFCPILGLGGGRRQAEKQHEGYDKQSFPAEKSTRSRCFKNKLQSTMLSALRILLLHTPITHYAVRSYA